MKQVTFTAAAVILITLIALVLVQFTYGGTAPELQLRDPTSLSAQSPTGTLAADRYLQTGRPSLYSTPGATASPSSPPAGTATALTPTAVSTPGPTLSPTARPAWAEMAGTPDEVAFGGALTTDGRYLYALRGDKSKGFWRYDPEANIWDGIAAPPAPVNQGGSLAYANGGVYAFRGDSNPQFWRYDTGTNSWVGMRSAPGNVGFGGALAWDGGALLYALQGTSTHDPQNLQVPNGFWRYNLSANTWTALQALPVRVYKGGALTIAAGRPYAFPGGGSRSFWFYDEPSGTWGQAAELPEPMDNGGALVYPGSGEYLYALRGGSSRELWRYNIRQNTWESLGDTPLPVGEGAALTVQNGALYALPGGRRNYFWKFLSIRLPSSGQPPPEEGPNSTSPATQDPTNPPSPQPTAAPTPAPPPTQPPTSPPPTAQTPTSPPPTAEPCVPIVLIKVCP